MIGLSRRGKVVYVIFDEAQNLKFYKRAHGIFFNEILGYVYDNLKNVRLILTGSEIGLLEEFIGSGIHHLPFTVGT
jgi:AAA+ ATPase superfamily predicted ATPase